MCKNMDKHELVKAIVVSLLSPLLYSFLCLTVHYGNILECSESGFTLALFFFLAPVFWGPVLFAVQYPFFGSRYFKAVNLAVFAGGVLLWGQANVFNWGFPGFFGSFINWQAYRPFMILELVLYFLIVLAFIVYREYFSRRIVFFSFLILAAQFAGLLATSIPWLTRSRTAPEINASWMRYDTDESEKYTFSKRRNIILLVVDSFPGFTADRILNEEPDVKRAFSDFTFYKNCRSYTGGTTVNVPAILTGRVLDGKTVDNVLGTTPEFFAFSNYPAFVYEAYNSPTSVPKVLKAQGYRVELYPEVRGTVWWSDAMVDNAVPRAVGRTVRYKDNTGINESCFDRVMTATTFRICPTWLKKYSTVIEEYAFWNAEGFFCPDEKDSRPVCFTGREGNDPDREFVERIESDTPLTLRDGNSFKYIHLFGGHVPHQRESLAAKGTLYDAGNRNASAEMTLESGYLRLVARFLDKLKEAGIYDNSTVIVMGDHVQHYSLITSASQSDYPTFDPGQSLHNNPLFLVKRAGEHADALRQSDDMIETADVASLMIEESGAPLPEGTAPFGKISAELRESRQFVYERVVREARHTLRKTFQTMKFQKQDLPESLIVSRQEGKSWFLFTYPAFTQLVLYGDRSDDARLQVKKEKNGFPDWVDMKRVFFLYPERENGANRYLFEFHAIIPFRRGDTDPNYKFVKAVFDRDVWWYQCLLDCEGVPDGRYRSGILEPRSKDGLLTETLYNNIITIKDGRVMDER